MNTEIRVLLREEFAGVLSYLDEIQYLSGSGFQQLKRRFDDFHRNASAVLKAERRAIVKALEVITVGRASSVSRCRSESFQLTQELSALRHTPLVGNQWTIDLQRLKKRLHNHFERVEELLYDGTVILNDTDLAQLEFEFYRQKHAALADMGQESHRVQRA